MLLIRRFRNRGKAGSRGKALALAINIGWFPLLPFLGMAFCALMLLTQFWEPMTVFGVSIPVIVFATLITALAIPLYLLSRGR
jgi:amino acid permease